MGDTHDSKRSGKKNFLDRIEFKPQKSLRTVLKIVRDKYTYNVKNNPFLWLGTAVGLPVTASVTYLLMHYSNPTGGSFLGSYIFWFIVGYPLWLGLLFGGLGTLYWEYHASLQHQATHDDLTNLLGHSAFHQIGKKRDAEARRYNKTFSIIMFDLDHFKRVNDELGHQTGDEVLQKVAEFLRSETRSADILGRYGGEEFAALLPETNMKDAYKMAERVRKKIEDDRDLPDYLTISGGVVSYPYNKKTFKKLMEMVDECLYYAKENGRNQICTVLEMPDGFTGERDTIEMRDMSKRKEFV
jgi:diguanylate cyclase (GGDEF)-like protein